MKLKAHINELGPVKDLDLELNQMVLLTGASGLGKSYTAFVLQYMSGLFGYVLSDKSLALRLLWFIKRQIHKEGNADLFESLEGKFLEAGSELIGVGEENKTLLFSFSLKDLSAWMKQDVQSYISYLLGYEDFKCDIDFDFELESDEISHHADDEFQFFLYKNEATDENKMQCLFFSKNGVKINSPSTFPYPLNTVIATLSIFIGRELNDFIFYSLLFPPARGGFLNLKSSTVKEVSSLGMYTIFLRNMDFLQGPREMPSEDQSLYLETVQELLGGNLKEQQGALSLELKNEKSIPISAAASSVKELVPMLLLLKKYGDSLGDFSVLFEEPEAHLHTTKQIQVADLLAKCMAKGTRFIVTTHSDYFLGRINQLIRLGNSKAQSEDAFKDFCAKKGWKENLVLQKEKISAYYFSEDNEGGASVKLLDITDGVPFDTFTSSVDQQFEIDGAIDDLKEELTNDSKEDSCDD